MPPVQFKVGIRKPDVTASVDSRVCELYFTDTIQDKQQVDWFTGEVTTESLLADVIAQVNDCNPTDIVSHVDSWGGDASAGLGIYNYLKSRKANKTTNILNKCASIATVIACAGDMIVMPRNGFYVIHQASTVAGGTSKDLREAADLTDRYTENILDVYVQNNRKGKTRDEIYGLISDYQDCWLTGEQAKEWGFVDDTYNDDTMTVTACVNAAVAQFGDKVPARILAMAENEPVADDNLINNFFMDIKKLVTAAIGKFNTVKVPGIENVVPQFTAAVQPILNEMAEGIEAQVTAEVGTATKAITDNMAESIAAGVQAGIDAYKAENDKVVNAMELTIKALTADIEKMKGRESNTPTNNGDKTEKVIGRRGNIY